MLAGELRTGAPAAAACAVGWADGLPPGSMKELPGEKAVAVAAEEEAEGGAGGPAGCGGRCVCMTQMPVGARVEGGEWRVARGWGRGAARVEGGEEWVCTGPARLLPCPASSAHC